MTVPDRADGADRVREVDGGAAGSGSGRGSSSSMPIRSRARWSSRASRRSKPIVARFGRGPAPRRRDAGPGGARADRVRGPGRAARPRGHHPSGRPAADPGRDRGGRGGVARRGRHRGDQARRGRPRRDVRRGLARHVRSRTPARTAGRAGLDAGRGRPADGRPGRVRGTGPAGRRRGRSTRRASERSTRVMVDATLDAALSQAREATGG